MSSEALDRGREAFRVEALELLEELETALLALEKDMDDSSLVDRIFRAMHTLKGSGGMFGFQRIEAFAHQIETVLDRVRDGQIAVERQLIDLSLLARDQIGLMLQEADGEENLVDEETVTRLLDAFQAYLPQTQDSGDSDSTLAPSSVATEEKGKPTALYHIHFRPAAEIFMQGGNPLLLLRELADMGPIRVYAQTEAIPPLNAIDPERCYTAWDVLLATPADEDALRDVFIFVEEESELSIERLALLTVPAESLDMEGLGDAFQARGALSLEEITQFTTSSSDQESVLESADELDPSAPVADGAPLSGESQVQAQAQRVSNIRVASEKLDLLVDLVGELVIAQARLHQSVQQESHQDLLPIAEDLERLTNTLRETAMEMRMVPIGTLFSKFKRLVRDLSRSQGKPVELTIEGGETELDKNVIERLNDPLVHVIRNCIDHGIESQAIRLFNQKPSEGMIRMSASHSGAGVRIVIEDDGAGLDTESIRRKALDQGLIVSDQEFSDSEIHQLIFHPGFSTKDTVSNLSGRGVGMDVVKRNIEALRGRVTLQSQKGKGTTLTIHLPLTLGIIDGLLTRIGDARYVFPLSAIEECVELQARENDDGGRHRLIHLRDQAVPYIRLRDQLCIPGLRPDIEQILITDHQGAKYGIVVDEVIGEQQVVIKGLGKMYKDVEGFSGATILGDGTVALILDIGQVIQDRVALEAA